MLMRLCLLLAMFAFGQAAYAQSTQSTQSTQGTQGRQGPQGIQDAPALTLGTGLDYTTGKYGASEKTEILYVPFYARYETGPWIFRLTVPYIRITGPGNVIGGGEDRVTVPGRDVGRRTESGLGDIVGSVFYNVLDERTSAF